LADTPNAIERFSPSARVNLLLAEKERAPFISPLRASLKPDSADQCGKMLADLLSGEEKYDVERAGSIVEKIVLTRSKESGAAAERAHRFIFAPSDDIAAYTFWRIGGIESVFELVAPDGTVVESKRMAIKPEWLYTYSYFKASREKMPGVWKVRVSVARERNIEGNRTGLGDRPGKDDRPGGLAQDVEALVERAFISAPRNETVTVR
jgi:hypothetical protein